MNILSLKQIGRYQITRQVYENEYTTVFQAFDPRLEREVVLKVLTHSTGYSADFSDYFLREARALGQLSHANIVKLLDFGTDQGYLYLVMESIQGTPLSQLLGKPIEWREAVNNLIPIMQALSYAHDKNIIHRDLKPENILITPDGRLVLTDFSIAKIIETEETRDMTGTNVGLGAPEYMSPEQGKGLPLDYRADIYALGVIFYEMVTGQPPFKADNSMEVVIQQVTRAPLAPSKRVSNLPADIETVILTALAKNPDDRFQSVKEMLDALELIKSGKHLARKPGGKRPASALFRWALGAVIVSAAALASLLIYASGVLGPAAARTPPGISQTQIANQVQTSMATQLVSTSAPAATSLPPTEVPATPAPAPTQPDLNSPVFDQSPLIQGQALPALTEKISGDNASSLVELARWGNPKLSQFAWNKNDTSLIFSSSSGIEFYASDSLAHQGVMNTGTWNSHIAVSQDNRLMAVGLDSGLIKLFDGHSGESKGELKGHSAAVTAIDFSPDGKFLASASLDHSARIWDLTQNKEVFKLAKHDLAVNCVVYSKDGKYILTGSNDFRAILWDAQTGEVRQDIRAKSMITNLAISSDDHFIVMGLNNATIQLWNLSTQKFEADFHDAAQVTGVTSLSLSPSDSLMASSGADEKIRIWSVANHVLLATLVATDKPAKVTKDQDPVIDVVFSHDGTRLASLTDKGFVKVWDTSTHLANTTAELNLIPKNRVEFSPDGKSLALQNNNAETQIWSVNDGHSVSQFTALMAPGYAQFSPNSQSIVLVTGKDLNIYPTVPVDKAAAAGKKLLGYPQNGIVSFAPDGKILAASQFHQIVLWSTHTALKLNEDKSKYINNCQAAYSKDGSFIGLGSNMGLFFDEKNGAEMCKIIHNPRMTTSAYLTDGRQFVFGLENGGALVYNPADISKPDELVGLMSKAVRAAAFSPDGQLMVIGGEDGSLQVIDVNQKKMIQALGSHTGRVTDINFSADGTLLATCSLDGTVRLWAVIQK